jgi:hypothetical protein
MDDLFEKIAERERLRFESRELPETKVSARPRKQSSSSYWRKKTQLELELRRYKRALKHGVSGTPKEQAK